VERETGLFHFIVWLTHAMNTQGIKYTQSDKSINKHGDKKYCNAFSFDAHNTLKCHGGSKSSSDWIKKGNKFV